MLHLPPQTAPRDLPPTSQPRRPGRQGSAAIVSISRTHTHHAPTHRAQVCTIYCYRLRSPSLPGQMSASATHPDAEGCLTGSQPHRRTVPACKPTEPPPQQRGVRAHARLTGRRAKEGESAELNRRAVLKKNARSMARDRRGRTSPAAHSAVVCIDSPSELSWRRRRPRRPPA